MGAHSNLGVFSNAQALVATAASTNTIDLAKTTPQIGVGKEIYLVVRVGTAFTTCTNYAFALEGDVDDGDGDPSGSWATTYFSKTVVLAKLIAGAFVFRMAIPYEVNIRHLRVKYTETGSTEATGTVDAYLEDRPASDHGVQVVVSPVGQP